MSSVYTACIGNSIPRTRPPPVLHITYQQPTSEATNKYQQGGSLPFQSHRTRPHFLYPPWVPSFHQLSSLLTHRNHSTQLSTNSTDPQLNIYSHIPFAIQKLHSRKENSLKLTGLPGLINWTAEASWTRVTGLAFGPSLKVSTNRQRVGAVTIRTKALGCNRARSLARAKNDRESR